MRRRPRGTQTNWRAEQAGERNREAIVKLVIEYHKTHGIGPRRANLTAMMSINEAMVGRHVRKLLEEGKLVEYEGRRLRTPPKEG